MNAKLMRLNSMFSSIRRAALFASAGAICILELAGSTCSAFTAMTMGQSFNGSYVSVLRRKFMPMYAMSLAVFYSCWTHAAMCVYMRRYVFKMYRVHAFAHAAKVINFTERVYRIYEHAVRNALGRMVTVNVVKVAVAIVPDAGSPQPTRNAFERYVWVYANLFKEAYEQLSVYGKSVRIVAGHRNLLKVNDSR
jgi:hypothetical protein